ncbi:MAG: hypothetical protein ACFFD4_30085 [Candidatus Odinarchaeota archaeon]
MEIGEAAIPFLIKEPWSAAVIRKTGEVMIEALTSENERDRLTAAQIPGHLRDSRAAKRCLRDHFIRYRKRNTSIESF